MDINKLTNQQNSKLNGTNTAEHSRKTSEASIQNSDNKYSDKVSLDKFNFRNNEERFAKIELGKLNQNSFEKLKSMKAKLSEYEQAKTISSEAAMETEIGKKLSSGAVWEEIAKKITKF